VCEHCLTSRVDLVSKSSIGAFAPVHAVSEVDSTASYLSLRYSPKP